MIDPTPPRDRVRNCTHLSHSPQGICTGCREQHEPLNGYSPEELAALEAEFWSDWNDA